MADNVSRLKDVETLEVSLVPKGANQRDFLLFKNKEGKPMSQESQESKENVNKQDMDMREVAGQVASYWDVTTGEALRFLEALNPDEPEDRRSIATMVSREYEGLSPVDVMETLSEAEGGNPDDYEKGVNITKEDLPDELKDEVEGLFKQYEQIKKENEEIKQELRKEKEQKRLSEFISKAEQFDNLPVNPNEFGKILKNFADSDEEGFQKLMEVLKSADESINQSGLFKERGSSIGDTASDAWGKIEKSAEGLMEEKGLSREQAINQVMKNNPELYRQYMDEKSN